jgi:hypothetical protein
MIRNTVKLIAAGVGLTASVSVLSAPLFSTFDVETRSGFTAFAPTPGVTGSDDTTLFDSTVAPQTISWGDPAAPNTQQSALKVTDLSDAAPLVIGIDGVFVPSGSLEHDNFPIFAPSLDTATLLTQIQLTPTGGSALPFGTLELAINFFETPNRGSGAAGNCPAGGVDGDADNVDGCSDIFIVDVIGAGFNASGQIVQDLGTLGDPGFRYTAIVAIAGVDFLDPGQCTSVPVAAPCVGFVTQENQANFATTSIAITATELPVPAPAPIFGLGLGLLLLARARRRS